MTENKDDWLYPNASGFYFLHDGFIMRAIDGKQYDMEEECDLLNEQHEQIEQIKKMYFKLHDEYLEFRRSYFQERELDVGIIEKIRDYPVEYYENPYTVTHEEKL